MLVHLVRSYSAIEIWLLLLGIVATVGNQWKTAIYRSLLIYRLLLLYCCIIIIKQLVVVIIIIIIIIIF